MSKPTESNNSNIKRKTTLLPTKCQNVYIVVFIRKKNGILSYSEYLKEIYTLYLTATVCPPLCFYSKTSQQGQAETQSESTAKGRHLQPSEQKMLHSSPKGGDSMVITSDHVVTSPGGSKVSCFFSVAQSFLSKLAMLCSSSGTGQQKSSRQDYTEEKRHLNSIKLRK